MTRSLTVLEYDKVIARLSKLCQTEQGRALATALEPSPEYREVVRLQRLTAEARRLTEMKASLGLADVRDVVPLVRQAEVGHALEPMELLDVQSTLTVAGTTQTAIDRLRLHTPLMGEVSDRIDDFKEVTAAIGRAIDSRGEITDNASPVLSQLRRDSRVAHDRLTSRMQQIVNSYKAVLQDPIVTLRDGRYVVPVKAELRGQLPGIVHDVSSSGATVFLEPLDTVEMGNRWRELLAEEQREIMRILRDLSALVGQRSEEIEVAVQALAEIDLHMAKVRLGEQMKAKELPYDGPDQGWLLEEPVALALVNARHPLLKGNVVPVTIWMGEQPPGYVAPAAGRPPEPFRILLITGPNTGGKTVALKTAGLLALMAQAGLPIPADGDSRLPVFDSAFADIGDEQSIEQSLSTFSSHMGNIISILGSATRKSLVLLDELAAGTDPVEGSALARAILSHLLATGCFTVATTHHGELKAYAHTTPGITNASVEFDADSLSPTYRLDIGVPGQSNALAIAERLGMPPEILEEALSSIDPDRLAVESLITDLHRQREEAETASADQRTAAREAQRARDRVTMELQSLQANRERLIERTHREMEDELQRARKRLRDALKQIERVERTTVFERAETVKAAKEDVAAVEVAAERIERKRRRPRRGPLPPIVPGDRVFLHDLPTPGEALTEPDEHGDLEVSLGALRASINVKQIQDVDKGEGQSDGARYTATSYPSERALPGVSPELDLRGMTVEEAVALVDQRLDEAVRAGISELRIIHGKGTGTLRRAIREMLQKHQLVKAHQSAEPREGGDGVTMVEVAS